MKNKRLYKNETGVNAFISIDNHITKISLSSVEILSKKDLKKFISKIQKLEKFLK